MLDHRFESLVTRLESSAKENPQRYLVWVLGVVLLGFAVLAIAILFALVPVALLAGLVLVVFATGGKALIVLLKLGKLIVLLIWPAWVMIKSSFQMLLTRFPRPQGRHLTEQEAPALFARIHELRQQMDGPHIHHVLLTDELNAAIVQHPRFGLFGWEENYLILGFPLLQAMSEEEALSVVAHEYGHLSGHHSRLGGFIYRFRSAWGRMQALSEQWTDWGSRLIARLFRWYAPYFNAYTFVLARQNEYVADRISAEVAGPNNAANALLRVNLAAQFEQEVFWPSINKQVAKSPQPLADRSKLWQRALHKLMDEASRVRYLDVASKRRTDHLDTHPALSDRLRAIGVEADEASARNLLPPKHSAAEIWLGVALPDIQTEFDQKWQSDAAERWQERHKYLAECTEQLAKLGALETLSTDERWDIIRLNTELDPDFEPLPLLNELLQLVPDHASALYRRGMLLLEREDEAGIADLENLMKKDASATLAACEAAWRFYHELKPELAEQYRERWIARSEYENRVNAEFSSMPADATLAEHDLNAEMEESIRKLVLAHGKYIRRAYLMRRQLKSDSNLHDYVLAFETKFWTLGDKSKQVIDTLAKQEFPIRAFIVHLGSQPYKRFRKPIKRLKIAPLVGR
ncbi:MAG TPA: M48 family metalloprotease [Sideroxyarcus sp.]|nr:M48 family metalloprotease [Sideroxyarcus sp.]